MSAGEDTSFARLVSLACHDLRTPLATVQGFARTLARPEVALGEPAARYVGLIDAASVQLSELLEDLGVAARIESGRYEPPVRAVDTLELARQASERVGDGRVGVEGEGAAATVDPDRTGGAIGALALCALRHGGVERVDLRVRGLELELSPITATAAPVLLGEQLRDLGAAVAVRLIRALGGDVAVDGDVFRITLPT